MWSLEGGVMAKIAAELIEQKLREGLNPKEIARLTGCSAATVRWYRRRFR